ncbi:MAG: DUF58 domain-containing protein [Planctomycetota bacterium]|nr:MAG: DUF58 domain-containing protein [Planctomycetota bacterium]
MEPERDVELSELLQEVRRIEVQSRRLVTGVMAGGYHSVFRGSGIEFEEVREYAEGDDSRSVDWNVTARVGRPYIKKYVDERELTVLFLLDLSASMTGGFSAWSVRQMATRICACLALSAVGNHDKVGLLAFSREVDKYVPPAKGQAHALRIVRDCLALPCRPGAGSMVPALEMATQVVRRKSIVFLISDFLSEGWRQAMQSCALRHDLIAVRLLPPELHHPPRALLRLRDPESGEQRVVDFRNRKVRQAYAERTQAWRKRNEELLRRVGVDRMDVPIPAERSPEAVAKPILEFFRMRELRGAKR